MKQTKLISCIDCGVDVVAITKKMSRCVNCKKLKHQSYQKKYFKNVQKEKRSKIHDPRVAIYRVIKSRSLKYKDQIFDLTLDDIKIPDVCPVFGTPFVSKTPFTASIDRIDNSRGYVRGNIQIISLLANKMKTNATQEQLEKFAHWILNKKDKRMNETQIENYVTEELEDRTFEEILEDYDLTAEDVFIMLFNLGHISPEVLEEQMRVYNFAD